VILASSLLLLFSTGLRAEKASYSLREILAIALENNPLLAAKHREAEARKASYQASKRLINPELEYQRGSATSWDRIEKRTTEEISLSQRLENPFKRHYRIQAYEKEWKAASSAYEALASEIRYEVKVLFYRILLLEARQELSRKNLESIQAMHRLIRKRVELGEVKELEGIKLFVETLKARNALSAA